MNVDRFHQPCLLPWTVILVPRGGHRQPTHPPCVPMEVFTTSIGPYHCRTFNRPSPSLRRHSLRDGVCTLRRFGTLTGTATACPLTMSSLGVVFGICFAFSFCFSFARISYCRSVIVSISRFELGFLDCLLEISVGHQLQSTMVVFLATE